MEHAGGRGAAAPSRGRGAPRSSAGWRASARAVLAPAVVALALGTACGLVLDVLRPGSAVHVHWLGRGPLADLLAALFATSVLAGGGMEARWGARWRRLASAVAGATCLLAAWGAATHARAVARGSVADDGSFPNACLVAAVLLGAWSVAGLAPRTPTGGSGHRVLRWVGVGVASTALVLGWIAAAGAVDYGAGRTADAIVVLGCRVHADGQPSAALRDRTVTACGLWKRGAAPVIVLSGGKSSDAPLSEPEAMRALALAEGVPAEALILDDQGTNTARSVASARRLADERGWRSVFAVSHDYHLARIRLLCDRAGLRVRTVPALETAPPQWKVPAVAREVLAWAAAWAF